MKKKSILIITPIVLLALAFFVVVPYIQNQNEISQYAFTLDSADGKVSLSDFRGKNVIVYFGYMYCPDICPTSLSVVSAALNKLESSEAKKFQLVFVSVDPDRDSLSDLKEYAQYFYPNAIGLTTQEPRIKEIANRYGAYYAKEYLEGSKMDYSVAHTANLYFMDEDGILAHSIKHVQSTDDVMPILKKML